MTLTAAEREALFADLARCAARSGGVVNRALFDTVCEFAAAGDAAAIRTLTNIYRVLAADLTAQHAHG